MMQFFTFAGKNSNDFGIHISGEATFNRPKRKFKEYDVTGRNGTLIIDEGCFENVDLEYPSFVVQNMPERIEEFANYMGSFAGYQRLEDTYAPDIFRMAQYTGGLEVKSHGYMNRSGDFAIKFNCRPQRFLKSGETPVTFNAAGTIWNRTKYNAKPFLRIYGNAAGTVGIGSCTITISSISSYVDIDCELMDAYKGAVNCNANVAFSKDEVVLEPGQNGIAMTGGITSVVITPRFFII